MSSEQSSYIISTTIKKYWQCMILNYSSVFTWHNLFISKARHFTVDFMVRFGGREPMPLPPQCLKYDVHICRF